MNDETINECNPVTPEMEKNIEDVSNSVRNMIIAKQQQFKNAGTHEIISFNFEETTVIWFSCLIVIREFYNGISENATATEREKMHCFFRNMCHQLICDLADEDKERNIRDAKKKKRIGKKAPE